MLEGNREMRAEGRQGRGGKQVENEDEEEVECKAEGKDKAGKDSGEHIEQENINHENIIKNTRRIIRPMNEKQRFQKAKAHVMDSLDYRDPRPESQSLETSTHFRVLYAWETSSLWQWLLFLLSYIFMYSVIMDNQQYSVKIALEGSILVLFWVDTAIRKYIKAFDRLSRHEHMSLVNSRTVLLLLMTADLLIFIMVPGYGQRPLRPFRVLRCFMPLIYDWQTKRIFISIASTYTNIVVYLIFFAVVIGGWALVGSRALAFDPSFRDPSFPETVDPFKNDYSSLGRMIFVMYVVATYDSYPDNQLIAVQNFEPNYFFFILFIFLNMFLFSSIPGSLVYIKFRETHSKLILVDEIRQQHSLIIAFVTLAEDRKNLSFGTLIKFLNYLYRYKIRYVEYITDICLRLDDNNNKSIQVNEFMQLSQIILENRAMLPPSLDDLLPWVAFRTFMKERLHLKTIVQHGAFELLVVTLILLSVINALFFDFQNSTTQQTLDHVFAWLFLIELLMRVVGVGPENFFASRWNNVDTFLVLIGVVLLFVPISSSTSSIARIGRIFRVASLLRVGSHSHFMRGMRVQVFSQLKMIFQVLLEIIPILMKFMPLFLLVFYVFAILGMELFYNSYSTLGSSRYNMYQQYSSFQGFIEAHYVMVQILTEAGWSMIAYDHGWRNPQYYAYVMLYFCFMHIIIVYIIATLIKGIFWEVYFTVDGIFTQRTAQTQDETDKDEQNEQRTAQIRQISQLIAEHQYIVPDSVLKRELYENNLDERIFHKLKREYDKIQELTRKGTRKELQRERRLMVSGLISDFQISIHEIAGSEAKGLRHFREEDRERENREQISREGIDRDGIDRQQKEDSSGRISVARGDKLPLQEISQFSEQDFQSEIEELFHKVMISPKVKYSHVVGSSKVFNQFLRSKFVRPEELIRDVEFDINFHPLYNREAMNLHIYEMHSLLNIETSKREQKASIIQDLFESHIINQRTVDSLVKKKLFDKVFKVDTNDSLRKLFLSQTNEDLIKKFEVEYFSNLYGYSFKEINKMTLEPLLRVEATLSYSLCNILRYPQIDNLEFFRMITHIEDGYSNKVLKNGSLFKFVYKLDRDDTWFSVEFKHQQEMKVHFIKTGVWCHTPDMQDRQVYYARDLFNWDLNHSHDRPTCQTFIKRLYQSFEGLAFSLLDEHKFFQTNPRRYIYDLYVQTFDAGKLQRFIHCDHEISKVMVVILSKEQKREELGQAELGYELTDLRTKEEEPVSFEFTFDDSDNDIYTKLKNLSAMDHEKIVQSEGLPLSYTINLMQELADTFSSYGHNFTYQIEKVYNDQFYRMTQGSKMPDESARMEQVGTPRMEPMPAGISLRVVEGQ